MNNAIIDKNIVIGRIRILGTSKNVGVVGLSSSKKSLKLEEKVVVRGSCHNHAISAIERDKEGVFWCWLPGEIPNENKLSKPTLLRKDKSQIQRYVNIISTSYIFAAAVESNFIRLFCTLDGNAISSLPEDIYKIVPAFPIIKKEDENVKWIWCDPSITKSKQATVSNSENGKKDSKMIFQTISEKDRANDRLRNGTSSEATLTAHGISPRTYELIDKIRSVEPKVNDILLNAKDKFLVFDCEGVNLSATGELTLLQIAYKNSFTNNIECVIFDIFSLKKSASIFGEENNKQLVKSSLDKLFGANNFLKYAHDFHMDVAALESQLGITINNIFDTQIMYELCTGKIFGSLNDFLSLCQIDEHGDKKSIHSLMDSTPELWRIRPLQAKLLTYARDDVVRLYQAVEAMWTVAIHDTALSNKNENHLLVGKNYQQIWELFAAVSEHRKLFVIQNPENAKERQFAFHPSEKNWMMSAEVFDCMFPDKINSSVKMELHDNLDSLLNLIPTKFVNNISNRWFCENQSIESLRDIILEYGQRPYAYFSSGQREWLCRDPEQKIDLEGMQSLLSPLKEKFGPDNRAGIDGSLHRISCMRDKRGHIYSLTYRVGRAVVGNTNLIQDILQIGSVNSDSLSVLILGAPGSGKTTIIRDIARVLSKDDMKNVVVVDTSNEICGDGLIPHFSVGMARRMMVPTLDQQASVLIEAVQNHTPDVIICDEIGREEEVLSARTVKERGVRCIGSAHGNLRSLGKLKKDYVFMLYKRSSLQNIFFKILIFPFF